MSVGVRPGRSPVRHGGTWTRVLAASAAAIGVVALVGCGSGKPAYCTDRTNLGNSVKGLTSLSVSSGVSGLKSQIDKVISAANALVSSAKSDFPSETGAISSSVDALQNSIADLPSSPSAAQIVTVTKDASSVVSSVKSFIDASSSKCS